jgi:hypothetical protein
MTSVLYGNTAYDLHPFDLPTDCIDGFSTILRIHGDYIPKEH